MTSDLAQTLKKGTLLIIETGEYSDRQWLGPVRLLKTINKAQLAEDFLATVKMAEWEDTPDPSAFLPWLIETGIVENVDNVQSWHVGSYGSFEP